MKTHNYLSTGTSNEFEKQVFQLFLHFIFPHPKNLLKVLLPFCIFLTSADLIAQAPLSATVDPLCSVQCCQASQPCNSTAGVNVTGELPPYSYWLFAGLV